MSMSHVPQGRRERRASKTAALLSDLYEKDMERFRIELNKRMVSWLDEIRRRAEVLRGRSCHKLDAPSPFAVLETARLALSSVRKMDQKEADEAIQQLSTESARVVAAILGPRLYRLVGCYERKYLQ
jgi:hypothetical protein